MYKEQNRAYYGVMVRRTAHVRPCLVIIKWVISFDSWLSYAKLVFVQKCLLTLTLPVFCRMVPFQNPFDGMRLVSYIIILIFSLTMKILKPSWKHGRAWSIRALKWGYVEEYFRKFIEERSIRKISDGQNSPYAKKKCLSGEFKIQSKRTINGPQLLGTWDRVNRRILYSSVIYWPVSK